MMGFTVNGFEEWGDVLDLVIDHAFESGGKATERDRGEIDDEVTLDDLFGNDAVVIIGIANARRSDPAEKISGAVADLLFTQNDCLSIPSAPV